MRTTSLRVALVAGLLALASGCSAPVKPAWIEDRIDAGSEQVLWTVMLLSMEKREFPVGAGAERPQRRVESGWRTSLAPFKGMGKRHKATIEYTPAAEPGVFDVRVRVRQESNEDIYRPIDPSFAKWEPEPDAEKEAALLMQYLRSYTDERLQFETEEDRRRARERELGLD